MGFYLRKSISVGMLRFNLSKSGIGVSGGVKGFRIGTGPKGTYVHAGRGGLYYREYLFRNNHRTPVAQPRPIEASTPGGSRDDVTVIESAPASEISDSTALDLLNEIRSRRSAVPVLPFVVVAWLVLAFMILAHSAAGLVLLLLSPIAFVPAHFYDQQRRTTVVMYDLDGDAEQRFKAIYDGCMALRECGAVWSVMSTELNRDYKRNAGASNLLQRKAALIGSEHVPFLKTNVSVASIRLHNDTLYFLPDRIFIINRAGIGAVSYADFHATSQVGRFIEDGAVPRDSSQVGQTWRYVNKNGGPDRRFNNNRQLPILAYQDVLFASITGVRAYLQVSRSNGADALLRALEAQRRSAASTGSTPIGLATP